MSGSSRKYTVGWICALEVELAASSLFLQDDHGPLQTKDANDDNTYKLGSINGHNVVMAVLPAGEYGTASAASVAKDMLRSFPDIRFGLMVGIGGGAPTKQRDIRLGDVVVSESGPRHGGVVQYDYGKKIQGRGFQSTAHLDQPPRSLRTALQLLRMVHEQHGNRLDAQVTKVLAKYPRLLKKHGRPTMADVLYASDVLHPDEGDHCGQLCAQGLVVERQARNDKTDDISTVHYGLVASGNTLLKDAYDRDWHAEHKGVLCFEMEAAGLMNTGFKCLVIRGICDYCDTHKNKDWQGYAAMVAAAYASDLLHKIPPSAVQEEPKMENSTTSQMHSFIVPFGRNKSFVGRKDILDLLLARIPPTAVKDDCQRTVLEGLGGIGKTQIALQAVYQVRDEHPACSVFWVSAINATTFENDYRKIGQQLKIEEINDPKADVKSLVKTALSREDAGSWLLIIDNADDKTLLFDRDELMEHLPFCQTGSILFTTRDHKAATRLGIEKQNIVTVTQMSAEESEEMLRNGLDDSQLQDRPATAALLNLLCHLPLAVRQASACMHQNGWTTAMYLKHCRSSDQVLIDKLLNKEYQDPTLRSGPATMKAVATTWLVSFDCISREDPLAAEFLRFMCFLAEKDIPRDLLPPAEEFASDKAIGCLEGYAFITRRRTEGAFDIHRLVRLAMRARTGRNADAQMLRDRVVARVLDEFPSDDWNNRDVWRGYMPHALVLLQVEKYQIRWQEKECQLGYWAGRCSQADGQTRTAVRLLEQVVAVEETMLAEEHPSRLASQHDLARAYQANGQVAKAVELLEHVVAVRETTLAEEHPSRLASQHALAIAYRANGQVAKAVELLEHVVAVEETTLAEEHPDRLASQHVLAIAYRANGQVAKAVELLEHVVVKRGTTLAEEHPSRLASQPDRLASQHALAGAYEAIGQVATRPTAIGQVAKAVELTIEEPVTAQDSTAAEEPPQQLGGKRVGRLEEATHHLAKPGAFASLTSPVKQRKTNLVSRLFNSRHK